MPRYDLMYWSVRVRDQQAAYARSVAPAPVAAPSPVERPRKPRVARPKPPRDEDAEHLLRLCRERGENRRLQNVQQLLELFCGDSWANVDGGKLEVRPPAAPTAPGPSPR